jgi:hypothetical protein
VGALCVVWRPDHTDLPLHHRRHKAVDGLLPTLQRHTPNFNFNFNFIFNFTIDYRLQHPPPPPAPSGC